MVMHRQHLWMAAQLLLAAPSSTSATWTPGELARRLTSALLLEMVATSSSALANTASLLSCSEGLEFMVSC